MTAWARRLLISTKAFSSPVGFCTTTCGNVRPNLEAAASPTVR